MEWGLNPATFQFAGGVATALALIGVIFTVSLQRQSNRRAARETELRMRPWIGLTDVIYLPRKTVESSAPDHARRDAVLLKYLNVGTLPAQNVRLHAELTPNVKTKGWPDVHLFDIELGGILPNQPTDAFLRCEEARSPFGTGVEMYKVEVTGFFLYRFGGGEYRTDFEGLFDFFWRADHTAHWQHTGMG